MTFQLDQFYESQMPRQRHHRYYESDFVFKLDSAVIAWATEKLLLTLINIISSWFNFLFAQTCANPNDAIWSTKSHWDPEGLNIRSPSKRRYTVIYMYIKVVEDKNVNGISMKLVT